MSDRIQNLKIEIKYLALTRYYKPEWGKREMHIRYWRESQREGDH
jgi:hypothetical protein